MKILPCQSPSKPPAKIMIDAPLGASDYGNEYGRPLLSGFFRTLEATTPTLPMHKRAAYKPLLLAGGCGVVSFEQYSKQPIPDGALIVVLGGPAMRIGLGGSSLSSNSTGEINKAADEASVQRSNPQMHRLCFEVINRFQKEFYHYDIIYSIHDVGAGGLSCAVPELLKDGGVGMKLKIEDIPCSDTSMLPEEIWVL